MANLEPGTPDWWVHRLMQRHSSRQERYQLLEDYAVGNHPNPYGDPRYTMALKEFQRKSKTNYIGLVIKAVTERMTVKNFKFGNKGPVDEDARAFWKANNMELQAPIAIRHGAKFGDAYALVSPPIEPGGHPVITVEDPRNCVVEPDPLYPLKSRAGLKVYFDSIDNEWYVILNLPDKVYTYAGAAGMDHLSTENLTARVSEGMAGAGFRLVRSVVNPFGECTLRRGPWQPDLGHLSMAECEDGAFEIQDRINLTVLARIIITNQQAYRQRWGTGFQLKKSKTGKTVQDFNPGADQVWLTSNKDAKFGDFEQADIRQLLEAIRDDIGDLAAITQTPVTYLTNRMVNVSGSTLTAAQSSLVSKVKLRQKAMGWFFEGLIKLCFKYTGDPRADAIDAETIWMDPEIRTMAEMADLYSKCAAAGLPARLIMEKLDFSEEDIQFAEKEIEKLKQEEAAQAAAELEAKASPPGGVKSE